MSLDDEGKFPPIPPREDLECNCPAHRPSKPESKLERVVAWIGIAFGAALIVYLIYRTTMGR